MRKTDKFLVFAGVLIGFVTLMGICFAGDGNIYKANGEPVVTFVPDPLKSKVPGDITGTKVFKKNPTAAEIAAGVVAVTGWMCMRVSPSADATYYFNSDNTKTYPLRSGTDNFIWVGHLGSGQSVSLVLGAATAYLQGM